MGLEIVRLENVRKQYFRKGRQQALHFDAVSGVDLSLHAGALVELVGRSGSGKSTLLNMAAGLVTPTEGKVFFEERDIYALDDAELSRLRNDSFGIVPQGQTPLFNLTVIENVKFPYLMYRSDDGVDSRAMELLSMLGIEELAECYPSELSGGEMRRMAIARALICKPKVIYADEPTGDLDDENTRIVLEVLRKAADGGAAVLVVTHEQAAADYADSIIHMDAGKCGEGCVLLADFPSL